MKKFEAGKTYYTYTMGGKLRLLKVISVDEKKMVLTGIFNGGKEKIYNIKNAWTCIKDREDGKPPSSQTILADNRYNLLVDASEYKGNKA